MKLPRALVWCFLVSSLLLLVGGPLVWMSYGQGPGSALFMGFAAAQVSVFSIAIVIAIVCFASTTGSRLMLPMAIVALTLKLPILGFLCYRASILGPGPRTAFMVGASLVYSSLIGTAWLDAKTAK